MGRTDKVIHTICWSTTILLFILAPGVWSIQYWFSNTYIQLGVLLLIIGVTLPIVKDHIVLKKWLLCQQGIPICVAIYTVLGLCSWAAQTDVGLRTDLITNLLALVLGFTIGSRYGAQYCLLPVVVAGSLHAAFAGAYLLFGKSTVRYGWLERASGLFISPNQLYFVVAFALVVAAYLWFDRPRLRRFLCVSIPLLITCLILTWQRAGVVTSAVAYAFIVWRLGPTKIRIPSFAALVLFVVIVFTVRFYAGMGNEPSLIDISARSRPELWSLGLQAFIEHPFLGVGVENTFFGVTREFGEKSGIMGVTEAKNVFIQLMAELGVVSIPLIGIFAYCVWYTIRKSTNKHRVALCALWLFITCASIIDNPFLASGRQVGSYLVGLLCGMTILLLDINLKAEQTKEINNCS